MTIVIVKVKAAEHDRRALPEQFLAVAVIQRALVDISSNLAVRRSNTPRLVTRKTQDESLDFIFNDERDDLLFWLEFVSDNPRSARLAIRKEAERILAQKELTAIAC